MDAHTQSPGTRRLLVDLADVTDALDRTSGEITAYLDLDTGEVISVSDDTRRELARIHATLPDDPPDDEAYSEAFAAAVAARGVSDWLAESLREADKVEAGLGARFREVPPVDSREGYDDMADFIETVASARLQDQLRAAIRGRGAFGRFKDALAMYPAERERWFVFKHDRLIERAKDWLLSEGIEPIPGDAR